MQNYQNNFPHRISTKTQFHCDKNAFFQPVHKIKAATLILVLIPSPSFLLFSLFHMKFYVQICNTIIIFSLFLLSDKEYTS